jgi:hypothetical protein
MILFNCKLSFIFQNEPTDLKYTLYYLFNKSFKFALIEV